MKAFDRLESYDLATKSDYFDAAMKRMDPQYWENLEVQSFWFYLYKFLFIQDKFRFKGSNWIVMLYNLNFIIANLKNLFIFSCLKFLVDYLLYQFCWEDNCIIFKYEYKKDSQKRFN